LVRDNAQFTNPLQPQQSQQRSTTIALFVAVLLLSIVCVVSVKSMKESFEGQKVKLEGQKVKFEEEKVMEKWNNCWVDWNNSINVKKIRNDRIMVCLQSLNLCIEV
jgi:hypothetical protein